MSLGIIKTQRLKDYKEGKIKFILLRVSFSMSPVRVGRFFGPVGRNGQKGSSIFLFVTRNNVTCAVIP
jgi:hypothetical protein